MTLSAAQKDKLNRGVENGPARLGDLLDAAVGPYKMVYAGKHTTVGGAAAEAKTVSGVLSTDVVIAVLQTKGATPCTIVTAAPTTDTITFTMSGDPSTDHIIAYTVWRAIP